jgi:hypothetical protein
MKGYRLTIFLVTGLIFFPYLFYDLGLIPNFTIQTIKHSYDTNNLSQPVPAYSPISFTAKKPDMNSLLGEWNSDKDYRNSHETRGMNKNDIRINPKIILNQRGYEIKDVPCIKRDETANFASTYLNLKGDWKISKVPYGWVIDFNSDSEEITGILYGELPKYEIVLMVKGGHVPVLFKKQF